MARVAPVGVTESGNKGFIRLEYIILKFRPQTTREM